MTLTYQRFTAVLLLIYGSLFLSGIYYCLRVFWCAAARMSELELGQRTNIKFLVKLGKSIAAKEGKYNTYSLVSHGDLSALIEPALELYCLALDRRREE